MTFKTKDYYIAACILASDIQLIELIPIDHKTFFFILNTSPEFAENIVQSYWQRNLTLPVRKYVDALYELKTRIHLGK